VRAEAWGSPETAIAAWEQLLRDPLKTSQAARELLRLGAIWNDLPATIVALKRVIQLYPQEPRFRIQLALSSSWRNRKSTQARTTLKELESSSQSEPNFCIASALAALRFGSPEASGRLGQSHQHRSEQRPSGLAGGSGCRPRTRLPTDPRRNWRANWM
jgi:hypothetical protein